MDEYLLRKNYLSKMKRGCKEKKSYTTNLLDLCDRSEQQLREKRKTGRLCFWTPGAAFESVPHRTLAGKIFQAGFRGAREAPSVDPGIPKWWETKSACQRCLFQFDISNNCCYTGLSLGGRCYL